MVTFKFQSRILRLKELRFLFNINSRNFNEKLIFKKVTFVSVELLPLFMEDFSTYCIDAHQSDKFMNNFDVISYCVIICDTL